MSTINGTTGDDVLAGTPDNDIFDGSAGFDTAQVAADGGDAVFSLDAQGRWVLTSPQGVDTLGSMEAVQFADATVTLGLAEFRVNTGTALDQTQPVLTRLHDGSFLATWVTGKNVLVQRFDENGTRIGAESAVPSLGPQPRPPQTHDVVALPDGGYLIAVVSGEMGGYSDRYGTYPWVVPVISVMRFGSDGEFAGAWAVAEGTVSSGGTFAPLPVTDVWLPTITALTDGNFLATWTREISTPTAGGSIGQAVRLDGSGAPLGAAFALPEARYGAEVAPLPGGGYALVSGGLTVQHFDSTGARLGDPVPVGEGSAASKPTIAALRDGSHVVVWNVQVAGGFELLAQRMDGTGVHLGGPVPVNSGPLTEAAQPTLRALDDGGYVVAWTAQHESDKDIHAQRFDVAGARVGNETVVNTVREGIQQQPAIAALEAGGFVVAWMSPGPGGDGWDIHGQRFDASGVALPSGHTLQGDGNANSIAFSGAQSIVLAGGDGDDVLQGGSGDDVLDGCAGWDTVVSADPDTAITWQLLADRGLHMSGPQSGNDTLVSVEQVQARGARIGVQFASDSEVRLVDSGSVEVPLLFPRVAVLSDGSSVLAWERAGGSDVGLYSQRFDPSGAATGAPSRIEASGKISVAALADGGYVLAWSSSTNWANISSAIDAQRFDASGTAVGPVVRVTTTDAGNARDAEPIVAGLADGGFVVTWTKPPYVDGPGVVARQFDASGSPVTPETRVNSVAGSYPGEQAIAGLQGGGYVVTWTMGDPASWPNDPGYDIHAQRFDANGAAAGGQTRVNASATGHQFRSEVAALADGGYLVSWMTDTAIMAQRFDAAGTPIGAETWVNPASPLRDGVGPSVAALADGGYVVAWPSGDYRTNGITAQRFDASGERVGAEFALNTATAGRASAPVLSALDDGGYVVTWLAHDSDGYSIETQRFDANNLREGHLTLTGGTEDNVLRVTSSFEGVELIGGGGKDILAAAATWDVLSGGSGGDTFEFAAAGNGVDTIIDWGMGDRISVAGASFGGAVTAGTGEAVALNAVEASTVSGTTTLFIGTDATPGADVVIRLAGSFAADSFTLNGNLIEAPKGVVVTGRGDLVGGEGDDTLIALHGVTRMEGGDGDDTYVLGNPNDRLIEQPGGGSDEVRSEWNYALGDNLERLVLAGDRHTRGTGNDLDNVVTGNGGRNVLTGGAGADTLTGGGGADQFVYRSVEESGVAPGTRDIVTDFSSLEGDRIDLRDIDANPARPGKQGFVFIGSAEFSSGDATGQLRFDAGTHMLYASTDADAQAEMAIELAGVTALAAGGLSL